MPEFLCHFCPTSFLSVEHRDMHEMLLHADRPVQPIASDGGSTDYYKLPEGAGDLLDLIDHKQMSFGVGNIFKACYRLGEKVGASREYDLRKIVFFAQRELDKSNT